MEAILMEEHNLPIVSFNNKYEWLQFVKKHRNIFNDKTTYRTHNYMNFYIVVENNYFQGQKRRWVWITDNKKYWIFRDTEEKWFNLVNSLIQNGHTA